MSCDIVKVVPPPSTIWVRFRQLEVSNFKPHPASTFFGRISFAISHWSEVKSISKCLRQAERLHISHRMSRLGWRHAWKTPNTKPPNEMKVERWSGRKMMRLVVVFPHASKPKKQRNSTKLIFSKHIKHSYEEREFKCVHEIHHFSLLNRRVVEGIPFITHSRLLHSHTNF